MGARPTDTQHVERLPGLRTRRWRSVLVHLGRGTGETGGAAERTTMERWPAGPAAPATFSAHGVSNGYPGTNDPRGGLVRHIGAWLAFAEACPPVSSSGSSEGRRLSLRASAPTPYNVRYSRTRQYCHGEPKPARREFCRSHEPLSGSLNSNGCRTSCRTRRPPRIAGV